MPKTGSRVGEPLCRCLCGGGWLTGDNNISDRRRREDDHLEMMKDGAGEQASVKNFFFLRAAPALPAAASEEKS